jgi:hypothetical protein
MVARNASVSRNQGQTVTIVSGVGSSPLQGDPEHAIIDSYHVSYEVDGKPVEKTFYMDAYGKVPSSGDHGSKYRVEVSARGVRTGSQNHNPVFRSARLILWHRSFPPSPFSGIGVTLQWTSPNTVGTTSATKSEFAEGQPD